MKQLQIYIYILYELYMCIYMVILGRFALENGFGWVGVMVHAPSGVVGVLWLMVVYSFRSPGLNV